MIKDWFIPLSALVVLLLMAYFAFFTEPDKPSESKS